MKTSQSIHMPEVAGRAVANSAQPRLNISRPGDSCEQEADKVAEQVMAMPESSVQRHVEDDEDDKIQMKPENRVSPPVIHRQPEEEEEKVQAKEMHDQHNNRSTLTSWLENRLSSSDPGSPLQADARSFMENRFGTSFAGVRIHHDAQAARMSQGIRAQAFTRGKDVYFNYDRYQPGTAEGKHLIAHELTHVIQQGGTHTAGIQRDFALEPPERPEGAPEVAELDARQVRDAIRYNRSRYNDRNTRIIQDMVGVEQNGVWNEETVQAIARVQLEYGMGVDGKEGSETFRFLDREMEAEEVSTETAEVLLLFRTPSGNVVPRLYLNPSDGLYYLEGHFTIEAQFSARTGCENWQYRQSIQGNAWAQRPGFNRANLNHFFTFMPTGSMPTSWSEDGNTSWAGINYGHREQPGRAFNPINRYETEDGTPDQRQGCIYKGEDYPSVTDANLQTGDTIELDLQFRGEIYRRDENGRLRLVQRNTWTVRGSQVVP